ncbi:MAG: type II toxin-antitoxin system RelE/ParE family toxin [Cyclobacteriaceae bacterium]
MKVIITEEAWQRLEKELDFLIQVRQLPEAKALSLGIKLLRKAESLSDLPYRGQEEPYLKTLKQGHKRLVEGDFKIIYRIVNDMVFVTNFFNTRRDPEWMKG